METSSTFVTVLIAVLTGLFHIFSTWLESYLGKTGPAKGASPAILLPGNVSYAPKGERALAKLTSKLAGTSWRMRLSASTLLIFSIVGVGLWNVSRDDTVQIPRGNITITHVEEGVGIDIQASDLPSNEGVKIFMNKGTDEGGWVISSGLPTTRSGALSGSVSIPLSMRTASHIYVKIITASNYIAYTEFDNKKVEAAYLPVIWIVSVTPNRTVTIGTRNFPSAQEFKVYMADKETEGEGGLYIGTFNSGGGEDLTMTFNIPAALYGTDQISIRAQNSDAGLYTHNWFDNNTSD